MPDGIAIKGGGLAACSCAALLIRAGHQVAIDIPPSGASPTLMLSDQTQHLLTDIFEGDDLLLDGAIQISRRVVLWGDAKEPVALPHSGLVVSESALLSRLWASLQTSPARPVSSFTVISSRQSLPSVSIHEFGQRMAFTNSVKLNPASAAQSCWVESVPGGWLFLIPSGGGLGSLISVGSASDTLLAESRLISHQIAELGSPTGRFPAYPRTISPLCGSNWLACGTAALAFDPIAGEGAGNALREGLLAAAVIRAIDTAGNVNELGAHYSNRLLNGFLRHLHDCCRFYEAVAGPWWESELQLMRAGIEWAQTELQSYRGGLFRLHGFDLQRIN